MRQLAAVLLLVTGCAAVPEPEEAPPPSVPAAERVSPEEVWGPEEVGGGTSVEGEAGVATSAGPSGGEAGDVTGPSGDMDDGTCSDDGDEVCQASAFGVGLLRQTVCGSAFYLACPDVATTCTLGEAVTLGSATIPCAIAIAAACIGPATCAVVRAGVK